MTRSFSPEGGMSHGAVRVTGRQILSGTHTGAVQVDPDAYLEIQGTLNGALAVAGRCTISGTVNGSVVTFDGGEILTSEGSVINGASHGTVGFGDLNGATSH